MFLSCCVFLYIEVFTCYIMTREFSVMSLAPGGPDPHRGSTPGPRWGTSIPQIPVPHPLYENPGSTTEPC